MPYRSDLEALEARYAALDAEVAGKLRARDEAARMLAEARARDRDQAMYDDWQAGGPQRRRQQRIAIAIGVSVLALMIGGLVHRHMQRPSEHALMEMAALQFEGFVDEACACKDKACTDEVQDRLVKWSQEMAKRANPKISKPNEKYQKRFSDLADRYSKCVIAAYDLSRANESTYSIQPDGTTHEQ